MKFDNSMLNLSDITKEIIQQTEQHSTLYSKMMLIFLYIMNKKFISTSKLSNICKIDKKRLSNILLGKADLKLSEFIKIQSALNVELFDINIIQFIKSYKNN